MGTRPSPRRLAVVACAAIASVYACGRLEGCRDDALAELTAALHALPVSEHAGALTEAAADCIWPVNGWYLSRPPDDHVDQAVTLLADAGADRGEAERIADERRARPAPRPLLTGFADGLNRTDRHR